MSRNNGHHWVIEKLNSDTVILDHGQPFRSYESADAYRTAHGITGVVIKKNANWVPWTT